jgi:Cytochrome bd terminal oxidase subunit I
MVFSCLRHRDFPHRRKPLSEAYMYEFALPLISVKRPKLIRSGPLNLNNHIHEQSWETRSHAPLTLFALPDIQAEHNRYMIEIPELRSLVLTHHADGVVPGLKDVASEDRPPMGLPFFAFRVMVGIGCLMLTIVVIGWYLRLPGICAFGNGLLRQPGIYDVANGLLALDSLPSWRDVGGLYADSVLFAGVTAGSPPKWVVNPAPSMACCEPEIQYHRR